MDFVILEKIKVYEGVEKVVYSSNFKKNNRVGKGKGKLVWGAEGKKCSRCLVGVIAV